MKIFIVVVSLAICSLAFSVSILTIRVANCERVLGLK